MDQQYSMTLGRPLGISGIGDCPPPHELTTNPTVLRFGEFGHHFTVLARKILSSDRLSNSKIDEFTDALRALLETMPESLQFNETWLEEGKEISEWPLGAMAAGMLNPVPRVYYVALTTIVFYCKIHNYLILLNRQRHEKHTPHTSKHSGKTPPPTFQPVNVPNSSHPSPTSTTKSIPRGRPLVLSSCEDILTAFLFFYARMPATLICWSMGQQAFNSCMILLLDAMETGNRSRIGKVNKAYAIFTELDKHGVHKLATLAVERVSWGLRELERMPNQRLQNAGGQMMAHGRGLQQGGDVEMQGAAGSEAPQGSGVVHDTVMGNTGMLLLEDPGLQSSVPEAFSPLSWSIGNDILEAKPRMRFSQDEKGHQKQGERICHQEEGTDRLSDKRGLARSSEGMQGIPGPTPGSAPIRHTTFSTAASQKQGKLEPQGPTCTPPSSEHHKSTMVMQNQPHHLQGMSAESQTQLLPLPYSRHHSYPSLHQHAVAPPLTSHSSAPHAHRQRINSFANPTPNPNPQSQPPPSAIYIPSLGGLAPLQTPSQILPGLSHLNQVGSPSIHSPWAARSATSVTHGSDALGFLHVSGPTQAYPASAAHHENWRPSFPFRMSEAGAAGRGLGGLVAVSEAGLEKG